MQREKPPEWREKQKGSRGIRRGQRYRLVFQFPIRQARQGASAGFSGCRGAALTQSRSDSGVYTGLTMRHQCGLYEKYAMPGVKCRTDA